MTQLIDAVILWEGEKFKLEIQTFGIIPEDWEGSLENHPLDDRVFYWLESNEARDFTKGYTNGDWWVRGVGEPYNA